ncbi:MAG: flagellin [Methanomicrobiaceae archaeon]|nr:flagellin [Methanomicrobiaceae archaeon]
MKNDDGVAPVVAGLLILAVIVTIMSVYFNTYVPSLKEEAEIEHLSNVEKEFLSFSSDLENAVWQKSDGRLSRNFELGGGDIFLSSLKSGGILEVEEDSDLFGVINTTGTLYNSSLAKFSYSSLSNFWQEQGYSWQYGYVNLTTGYGKTTPLQFADMNEVLDDIKNSSGLFSSLFDMEYRYEPVFQKNESGYYTGTNYLNCSEVNFFVTGFNKGEKSYASGNGVAMLSLETAVNSVHFNETAINFTVYDDVSSGADITLWKNINSKLNLLKNENFNNVKVSCYSNPDEDIGKILGIQFNNPVKVNIKQIQLTISAY